MDSVSASLPSCCSSNSAAVAHSTHTLHHCQTWAGGEKGRTHIHTRACPPHTQKHTHTRTHTDQTWAWHVFPQCNMVRIYEVQVHISWLWLQVADRRWSKRREAVRRAATSGGMEAKQTSAVCPRLRKSRTWTQQVWVNYTGKGRGGTLTFLSRGGEGLQGVAQSRQVGLLGFYLHMEIGCFYTSGLVSEVCDGWIAADFSVMKKIEPLAIHSHLYRKKNQTSLPLMTSCTVIHKHTF